MIAEAVARESAPALLVEHADRTRSTSANAVRTASTSSPVLLLPTRVAERLRHRPNTVGERRARRPPRRARRERGRSRRCRPASLSASSRHRRRNASSASSASRGRARPQRRDLRRRSRIGGSGRGAHQKVTAMGRRRRHRQPAASQTVSAGSSAGSAEQLVDELPTALLEVDARLDRLEHPEAGRQPDVEGCSLSRRDAKPCSVVSAASSSWSSARRHRVRASSGCVARPSPPPRVSSPARTRSSQLRRRGLGERDRREVAQLDVPGRHQRHDPVDERGGLPGAGAGLDEQARVVRRRGCGSAPPARRGHRAHSVVRQGSGRREGRVVDLLALPRRGAVGRAQPVVRAARSSARTSPLYA